MEPKIIVNMHQAHSISNQKDTRKELISHYSKLNVTNQETYRPTFSTNSAVRIDISRLQVFQNISTVNMNDFYTEFPQKQHQDKHRIVNDSSVSKHIIENQMSNKNGLANVSVCQNSSDLTNTLQNTEAVDVQLRQETQNEKQCISSAGKALHHKTLEKLQEAKHKTPSSVFQEQISEFRGGADDESTKTFPEDKLDNLRHPDKNVYDLQTNLPSGVKFKENAREVPSYHIKDIFSQCVGRAKPDDAQIDDYYPVRKKLKSDATYRDEQNILASENRNSQGWTQKVFEKWGQGNSNQACKISSVRLENQQDYETTVMNPVPQRNHSKTIEKDNQVDQSKRGEKEDRRKRFRKWLTERASCWSRRNRNKPSSGSDPHSSVAGDSYRAGSVVENTNPINNGGLNSPVTEIRSASREEGVLPEAEDDDGESIEDVSGRPSRLRPRNYRQFLQRKEHRTRAYLKERSHVLGRWFVTHFTHPYPSKEQKDKLARQTNMSRNQVSEWFGNMRRRVRDTTRDLAMCWEERVQRYNSLITGKSEPLPIEAQDFINSWKPQDASIEAKTWVENERSQRSTASSYCDRESWPITNFKKGLLHRYLNDSGEDLQPSSSSATFSRKENCYSRPAPLLKKIPSSLSESRTRLESSHPLPVARVDPWPTCNTSNSSVTVCPMLQPKQTENLLKERYSLNSPGQITLSHGESSPQLRTYSRGHRLKSSPGIVSAPKLLVENMASPNPARIISLDNSTFQLFSSGANNYDSYAPAPELGSMIRSSSPRDNSKTCAKFPNQNLQTTSDGKQSISEHGNFISSQTIFQSTQPLKGRFILPIHQPVALEKHVLHGPGEGKPFICSAVIIPSSCAPSTSFQIDSHSIARSSDELSAAYTLMQLQKM